MLIITALLLLQFFHISFSNTQPTASHNNILPINEKLTRKERLTFDSVDDAIDYYEMTRKAVLPRFKDRPWYEEVDEFGEQMSASAEQALYRHLLGSRYMKHVRPVRNHAKPITVKVGMCVMMIEDLIERDQIMIMASCVKMSWIDEQLIWNPIYYDNVTVG